MNDKLTKQPHPGVALLQLQTNPYYKFYIKSEQWKRKVDNFKMLAGYRCRVCFSDGPLEAHHRTYRNLGNETDYDITVLCRECHEFAHRRGPGE